MDSALTAALVAAAVSLATAVFTALQTTNHQTRQFQQDMERKQRDLLDDFQRDKELYRTYFMAETVAVELLQEPTWFATELRPN